MSYDKCPHCEQNAGTLRETSSCVGEEVYIEYYHCQFCKRYYEKEFDLTITFKRYNLEVS